MLESKHMEELQELIAKLQDELNSVDAQANDADVVFLNVRGVFETNFESKRVQLKFLNGIKRAAEAEARITKE